VRMFAKYSLLVVEIMRKLHTDLRIGPGICTSEFREIN
jgi:hypothetical protein